MCTTNIQILPLCKRNLRTQTWHGIRFDIPQSRDCNMPWGMDCTCSMNWRIVSINIWKIHIAVFIQIDDITCILYSPNYFEHPYNRYLQPNQIQILWTWETKSDQLTSQWLSKKREKKWDIYHPAFLPLPCQAPIGTRSSESFNPST